MAKSSDNRRRRKKAAKKMSQYIMDKAVRRLYEDMLNSLPLGNLLVDYMKVNENRDLFLPNDSAFEEYNKRNYTYQHVDIQPVVVGLDASYHIMSMDLARYSALRDPLPLIVSPPSEPVRASPKVDYAKVFSQSESEPSGIVNEQVEPR